MIEHVRTMIAGQFEAALAMLNDCLVKCPPEHWNGPAMIAKYPFWQVAYHTLCFVDLYLSPGEKTFEPRVRDFHPQGWKEFDAEYPSRRFEKAELLEYMTVCLEKARRMLAVETGESLLGTSGQSHLPFSRGELRLYNIRHIQHHTGQLNAFLRRVGAPDDAVPKWVKSGWR